MAANYRLFFFLFAISTGYGVGACQLAKENKLDCRNNHDCIANYSCINGKCSQTEADGALLWAHYATCGYFPSLIAYPDKSFVVVDWLTHTGIWGVGELSETHLEKTQDGQEIVLARFNADGSLAWAKKIDGESGRDLVLLPFSKFGLLKVDHDERVLMSTYSALGQSAGEKHVGTGLAVNTIVELSEGAFAVSGDFEAGDSWGQPEPISIPPAGAKDAFVAKFDSHGRPVWVQTIGGERWDSAEHMTARADGSVVVVGSFSDRASFGSGEAQVTLDATGNWYEGFVAVYSADGQLDWVRSFGHSCDNANAYPMAVAIDEVNAAIYVTGYFAKCVTFAANQQNATTFTTSGSEMFVARFGFGGDFHWARATQGTGQYPSAYATTIAANQTQVFVAGAFSDTAVFGDNNPTPITLVSAGNKDAFVAAYSADGSLSWVRKAGGICTDAITNIGVVDETCLAVGYYECNATFGPNEPNQIELPGSAAKRAFYLKLQL